MFRLPKFSSIQSRLGIFFLALFSFLVVLVGVTLLGLNRQMQNTSLLKLAARQCLLLQEITTLSLNYELDTTEQDKLALQNSMRSYDKNLFVMLNGGEIRDNSDQILKLNPPHNKELVSELESLNQAWSIFQENLFLLIDPQNSIPGGTIAREIEIKSISLINQTEQIVHTIEKKSASMITQFIVLQAIFLIAGMLLLTTGWIIIRKSIVFPFTRLIKSADGIKNGNQNAPITIDGPLEMRAFGRILEAIRTQRLTSQPTQQDLASKLEAQVLRRTKELEALAIVTREISSHLSINEVLKSVTEKAQRLSGAEVASLCILDEQGKVLNLHAATGSETTIIQSQSPADNPIVMELLQRSTAQSYAHQDSQGFCQIIHPKFRRSHLAVSLHSESKVIGALCIGSSRPEAFRAEIEIVLTQLAAAAEIAMENSRLYLQAQNAATLKERQRITSEMHDGLLQTLSFLGLMVRAAKEQIGEGNLAKAGATLQQIERAGEQLEVDIRRSINNLQEDFPVNYTLQEQLNVLAEELSKQGPVVQFTSESVQPLLLPRPESEQALRVVREALLNAQRHSQSERVYLTLCTDQNEISIIVEDQGIGFEPNMLPNDCRTHFGIKVMQARTVHLGGELIIQSRPGNGTKIQLRWTPESVSKSLIEV